MAADEAGVAAGWFCLAVERREGRRWEAKGGVEAGEEGVKDGVIG